VRPEQRTWRHMAGDGGELLALLYAASFPN
jgi:hypothetical protein